MATARVNERDLEFLEVQHVSITGGSYGTVRIVGASHVLIRGLVADRVEFFTCADIDWEGGSVGLKSGARRKILIGSGCPQGKIIGVKGNYEYVRVNAEGQLVRTGKNEDREWEKTS